MPKGPPSLPQNFSATAGNSQVTLTWQTPLDNAGAVISDYIVQMRRYGSSNWSSVAHDPSDTISLNVTGLTNKTKYEFQVAAVNSEGTSSFTASLNKTPFEPVSISAYQDIRAETGKSVSIQTPTSNGGLGTKSFAISPALPNGMSFSASTGAISGVPTLTVNETSHVVTVSDATSATQAETTVKITVQDA